MIPTFLIDIPVLILFGVLFAPFANKDARDSSIFSMPSFWHGLLFSTLFNVAVFYAVLRYPDWMSMYFTAQSRTYSAIELIYIFLFFYYVPYFFGFYLGDVVLAKGRGLWIALILLLAVSEVWIVAHLFDRYSVIGTNQDYINKTGISLFSPQNPIGPAMNGSVGLMILYYLGLLWAYRKKSGRYADEEY